MKYLNKHNIVIKRLNESSYNTNTNTKLNDILDKIANNGLDSLSDQEKHFLKSFNSGNPDEESYELDKIRFNDDHFEFEVDKVLDDGEKKIYQGSITIPSGESYKGSIQQYHKGGMIDNDFDVNDGGLTIWDKVEGLEHEFDNFIQNFLMEQETKS